MGNVLGRDAELQRCRAVFDSSAKGHIARAIRILGPTGVGKTALARAVGEAAAAGGWLVASTASYRIQVTLPLFAARQTARAILEALGSDAGRYQSGLELERGNPEEFEEAFLRIVEGVTLDHRLLLLIDDAQWADEESRTLVARVLTSLADRAIVLLSTERSGELAEPAFQLRDESIALGDLLPQAALETVRSIYTDVNDEVASAIVTATRGHAVDLVAVSTAAREHQARTTRDVSESTRRVVARDLALLDPGVRTFLQICALIDEPIEVSVLALLWSQDQLAALISEASARYLIAHGDELRFVHATIMESVLETIPIAIPLRHRIIGAIRKIAVPRLEDLERLAKQAHACGNFDLEHDALLQLADAAEKGALWTLAVDALERAIAIRAPESVAIIPTFTRLSVLYNALGRELETIRTCQTGIALAKSAGLKTGLASLGASMILAMWHAGRTDDAIDELRAYEQEATDAADRSQILSTGLYLAMNRNDRAEFSRLAAEFETTLEAAPPFVQMRARIMEAFLGMRSGDEASATAALRRAERLAESLPPVAGAMPRVVRGLLAFRYRSVLASQQHLNKLDQPAQEPVYLMLQPHVLIARGELNDAVEFCSERLNGSRDPLRRRLLVGPMATAAALSGRPPHDPVWSAVAAEASLFEEGQKTSLLWPIAAAWSVLLSTSSPKRASGLMGQLVKSRHSEMDVSVFPYPVLLAMTARTLNDRHLLEQIAGGVMQPDDQPWNLAHHFLARAVAAAALGMPERIDLSTRAAERFDALDAPFWASYARELKETALPIGAARERRKDGTTRREREIAALVAEGHTNRQIAEKLVLSERTVEGHIANLFAKVNVNSRTQLAAWYIRTTNSVA